MNRRTLSRRPWAAMMPLLLAGMSCISHAELKPRDLPPVTWKKAPAHPPVEVVRDGLARAVIFVADPAPSPKLERLVDELIEVIRLSSGAELKRV